MSLAAHGERAEADERSGLSPAGPATQKDAGVGHAGC